jgi:chitin synthase
VFAENSLMLNVCSKESSADWHQHQRSTATITAGGSSSASIGYNGKSQLYICATMWHENENEMLQLLKSIIRLDIDQSKKRASASAKTSATDFNNNHHEVFDYEAHIFFDDAIAYLPTGSSEPNTFVEQFISIIKDAAM